jgi:Domain of unknown function (DUF5122) beta-propeller
MWGVFVRLLAKGAVGVVLLSICVPAATAAPLGASGSRSGAHQPVAVLDPSFGSGGVTAFPSQLASTAIGVATQDGNLVVSGGSSIQLLSNFGGTGEVFGGVGSLAVPSAGGREFALGDFTLDSQDRLVVVGSSVYPEAENPSPMREDGTVAFKPAALRILRFLPDGSLDPSFGQGGVVESDLSLPSPRATDGRRRLGSHPSVQTTGVAVDSQGRIVLTGNAVIRLGRSCERNSFAPGVISAGFVARLGENGAPDPTFGTGGLVGGHHFEELPLGAEMIEEPIVGPSGNITYRSSAIYRCVKDRSHFGIAQLTQTGQARSAFGKKGALVGRYRAIAGGSEGSVFALAEVLRHKGERFTAGVTQIAPDGKPNGSFGTDGRATVMLGTGVEGVLNSLVVDGQGRILAGGTFGSGNGRSMVLLRLSAAGRQQMNFGPQGKIASRVSGLADPSALFFDSQGRLLNVHLYENTAKGRFGLVVARYLLRN